VPKKANNMSAALAAEGWSFYESLRSFAFLRNQSEPAVVQDSSPAQFPTPSKPNRSNGVFRFRWHEAAALAESGDGKLSFGVCSPCPRNSTFPNSGACGNNGLKKRKRGDQ
jgi:hypothetical protein